MGWWRSLLTPGAEWPVPSRADRRGIWRSTTALQLRARRGISLFEAVAAVAVVGMTAISALAAVGAEMRTAERARRAVIAEALATSRTDAMELLTDAELQVLPDSVATGRFPEPLDDYQWTAASAPHELHAGLYTVAVTISWQSGSYTVRTQMYRRPPLVLTR
jgi:type II secretory pathway pseudopilin PulG